MEQEQPKKKAIRIKIEVDEKLAGGVYANLGLVNQSDSEFVLDYFFVQPQRPAAHHCARLVISPRTAKRLHKMLGDHLARYEQMFGAIEIRHDQTPNVVN